MTPMAVTLVHESAEHHFLTFLERVREKNENWVVFYCAFPDVFRAESVIQDTPARIKERLAAHRRENDNLAQSVLKDSNGFSEAVLYQFADGHMALVIRPKDAMEQKKSAEYGGALETKYENRPFHSIDGMNDFYRVQKLADERLLSLRRIEAYEVMADQNRVDSIPSRRQRRRDTLVLVVEDDRFTASFAASILSKSCELVHAKTGEEALISYIEHAPDIVFLDIHLPGMSGHETLAAFKKCDPDAYVIMLSVDTVKPNIVQATLKGAAGFIKKPFTKERLLAAVAKSPRGNKAAR